MWYTKRETDCDGCFCSYSEMQALSGSDAHKQLQLRKRKRPNAPGLHQSNSQYVLMSGGRRQLNFRNKTLNTVKMDKWCECYTQQKNMFVQESSSTTGSSVSCGFTCCLTAVRYFAHFQYWHCSIVSVLQFVKNKFNLGTMVLKKLVSLFRFVHFILT